MKLVINNKNFGDIRTAVFYRGHKYIPTGKIKSSDIPELIQLCTSDRVQYQGSKSKLSDMDFAEYDFSYFIEKYKFNDKFLISLLDDQSKDLIGKNIDDLEKTEITLFPTLRKNTKSSEKYNYDYFGTALISNQNFLLFNVPGRNSSQEGYYKIELYEEVLDSNNSTGSFIEHELLEKLEDQVSDIIAPSITIILGPGNNIKNNPDSLYYIYDPILSESRESLSIVDYRKLREEINCSKVVYLYLTKDSEVVDVNLAYKSWIDSNNSNRNTKDYIIRNDEYYSTRNNINILENLKNSDFWFDNNSGTIVGSSEYEHISCLLLRKKLSKINNKVYSPYIRYNKGDIVRYGKNPEGDYYYWESLVDNNYYSNPFLSPDWVESSKIDNFFTRRINILIYPLDSGHSNPGGSITINSINQEMSFNIQPSVGYNIYYRSNDLFDSVNNHTDPCYLISPDRDDSLQLDQNNWEYKKIDNGGSITETITIKDWSSFFEKDESGAFKYNDLIFNFGLAKSFISFKATDGVTNESDYKDWCDNFNEPNLKISSILVTSSEGIENSLNPSDIEDTNKISVDSGSKLVMNIPELTSHSIEYIESTYKAENNTKKIKIYPKILDDKSFEFTDIVNFSEADYLFHLIAKTLTIMATKFEGYVINEVIGRVEYNNDYLFKFYNKSESDIMFNKLTIIEEVSGDELVYLPNQLDKEFSFGGSSFNLTLEDDSIYSLSIKGVKSNYKIVLE